jgi:DNA-binding transcriptional LysR family regulator
VRASEVTGLVNLRRIVRVHVLVLDISFGIPKQSSAVDTRRLQLLAELARLGSMREVAASMHTTTSTVSQQLAVLASEMGATLLEPDGRRVRLTPAGARLAGHAVEILAAVEAARRELDPNAEPAGVVRVAGFATAVRRTMLTVIARAAADHPRVQVVLDEHEPDEAYALLAADEIDLALTYDYDLAPAAVARDLEATRLWSTPWGLGVPAGTRFARDSGTVEVFTALRDAAWIGNSRNGADEEVLRTLAAMADFQPRVVHRADSLDLVQDFILAGLGVGLLPADEPTRRGVRLVRLVDPAVTLRAYAVTRRGRRGWPPLALVLRQLAG